jgi:hypothetical protein
MANIGSLTSPVAPKPSLVSISLSDTFITGVDFTKELQFRLMLRNNTARGPAFTNSNDSYVV